MALSPPHTAPRETPRHASDAPSLLLLCTGTKVGGMERVAVSLARGLDARGWRVRTVFPDGPDIEALRAWVAAEGVPADFSPALVHLGRERTLDDLRALRALVRASGCDVVNLHYGANHISLKDVLAVRLGRKRVVASVHHPTSWSEANHGARRSTALASRLTHRVIVNSTATANITREAGVSPRRLALVPCGVQPPARTWQQDEARRTLGLPLDVPIVGTLARLVPEKRVDLLIEAVARLPQPPVLVVAGDGPERASLEALAQARLGTGARFLGRVPDPEPLYASLDVFALPSDLEGFGLVYLEAAMQGVPSIGTRVGGVPDAIEDGRTGLLVPPGDPAALADALGTLLRDPAQARAMGERARERALFRFTEEAMAAAYERVLLR